MAPSRHDPTVPVIVMGAHIAALGALRLLARRGTDCRVIDDTDNVITSSRWYRPTEPRLMEGPDPVALAETLERVGLDRAVLLPCSDQWALAVAGLPAASRARFPTSLAPLETVAAFVDKERFAEVTERLDLPRPRTRLIRDQGDLDAASDDEVIAGFLKPTGSQRHNRVFGTKGMFIESRPAAAAHVRAAGEHGITFLLQEWIPGDPSATILLDGFVDRSGRLAALVARRRVRMDPPRLANTCSDVTIPLAEVEDAVATLRALLEGVAYRGIFNVEFKYDARDGRHKIIEVNPRPFWLIAHIARAGVDLAHLAYLDALEMPLPERSVYRVGRYGMYELVDAKAIARAVRHGRRPHGPVVRPWLTGDRALFWWRDPLPAVHGIRQALRRRVDERLAGTPSGEAPPDAPGPSATSASSTSVGPSAPAT